MLSWTAFWCFLSAWIVGKLVGGFKARLETYGTTPGHPEAGSYLAGLRLPGGRLHCHHSLPSPRLPSNPSSNMVWSCLLPIDKDSHFIPIRCSRLWAKNNNARTACWPSWTSKDRLKCPKLHQHLKAASLLRKIIESLWRVSPCVSFIGPSLGWDPTTSHESFHLGPLPALDPPTLLEPPECALHVLQTFVRLGNSIDGSRAKSNQSFL